ncbi:hypothetical protein SteCoe_31761 [Stentor coeruleus]|uniref:Uncharacterized protein n=1 Tax=Stentor coeruleus TaxID=5963 RepID=A0A1R2B0T1_9CILI|nr:hypothetical protein SteCoe_31761 [Stentor coeruleus]
MSISGNKRLREYIEMICLPNDMNAFTKYNCKALEYYREVLKHESENKFFQGCPPSLSQSRVSLMLPPPSRPMPTYTSISSRPYNTEPEVIHQQSQKYFLNTSYRLKYSPPYPISLNP